MTEDDYEFEKAYWAEQRQINKGPRDKPCPTCGEPNRMTQGQLDKGYHCDECTRIAEQGF